MPGLQRCFDNPAFELHREIRAFDGFGLCRSVHDCARHNFVDIKVAKLIVQFQTVPRTRLPHFATSYGTTGFGLSFSALSSQERGEGQTH
jgi:hypothetical protein